MINFKQELYNYQPIDLKKLAESGPDVPDNVKNSIVLYNKALESLRMDSEDIAIIELKKAISMNPNFFQAMNLLGLCYSYIKDYSKAYEMFERVTSAENNSVKAVNYLNQLNSAEVFPMSGEAGKKNSVKKYKEKDSAAVERKPLAPDFLGKLNVHEHIKNNMYKYLAGFTAGMLIIAMIGFAYGFKASTKSAKPAANTAAADTKKVVNDALAEQEAKYNKLNDEFTRLKTQLEAANTELDYYRNVSKLNEIEMLIGTRNYEAAADRLVSLKALNFKEAERDKYNNLYKEAVPRAAWAAFTDGSNLFYSKRYQEALEKLGKVQTYGSDWAYMDITMYYMGVSYKELNDYKNALAILNKLKETYPGSQYTEYAGYRIREITGEP